MSLIYVTCLVVVKSLSIDVSDVRDSLDVCEVLDKLDVCGVRDMYDS
jgi:hypothetical protein